MTLEVGSRLGHYEVTGSIPVGEALPIAKLNRLVHSLIAKSTERAVG